MTPPPRIIAGAILEEAILAILREAGFSTLSHLYDDPSIDPLAPAVTIHGRGTTHQIDAVADPLFVHAFSNPPRLLVEGKAYEKERVDLRIVRNAVGTLKDLTEFWRPVPPTEPRLTRYHYRYAIFSTTDFTDPAQRYAYAQDVYLLPLRRSAFFRPVVEAIDNVRDHFRDNPGAWRDGQSLSEYRRSIREWLNADASPEYAEVRELHEAVRRIRVGLIAIAERQFPIFLIPSSPDVIAGLSDIETVRFYYDNESWYIRRPGSRENLFSFDLPDELFSLYAQNGALRQEAALRLKAERLAALQAFHVFSVIQGAREHRVTRLIQFRIDQDWITRLQHRATVPEPEA